MEPKTYIALKKVAVNGKHLVEGDVFSASLTKTVESEGFYRKLYRYATEEEIETKAKPTVKPVKETKK